MNDSEFLGRMGSNRALANKAPGRRVAQSAAYDEAHPAKAETGNCSFGWIGYYCRACRERTITCQPFATSFGYGATPWMLTDLTRGGNFPRTRA